MTPELIYVVTAYIWDGKEESIYPVCVAEFDLIEEAQSLERSINSTPGHFFNASIVAFKKRQTRCLF